jgi:hypothetical protein
MGTHGTILVLNKGDKRDEGIWLHAYSDGQVDDAMDMLHDLPKWYVDRAVLSNRLEDHSIGFGFLVRSFNNELWDGCLFPKLAAEKTFIASLVCGRYLGRWSPVVEGEIPFHVMGCEPDIKVVCCQDSYSVLRKHGRKGGKQVAWSDDLRRLFGEANAKEPKPMQLFSSKTKVRSRACSKGPWSRWGQTIVSAPVDFDGGYPAPASKVIAHLFCTADGTGVEDRILDSEMVGNGNVLAASYAMFDAIEAMVEWDALDATEEGRYWKKVLGDLSSLARGGAPIELKQYEVDAPDGEVFGSMESGTLFPPSKVSLAFDDLLAACKELVVGNFAVLSDNGDVEAVKIPSVKFTEFEAAIHKAEGKDGE